MPGIYPNGPVGIALLVVTIILAITLVALLVVCGLLCKHGYFTNPFSSQSYQILEKNDDYLVVDTVKKKIQPSKNDPVDFHVYPARFDQLIQTKQQDEIQMLTVEDDKDSVSSSTSSSKLVQGPRHPRPDSGVPYQGLGRLIFQLRYSAPNETLCVHMLHGRQISRRHGELAIWPVVRVSLIDSDDVQETSPDESPNPEYDQELNFLLSEADIGQSAIFMAVWDTDTHEQKTLIGYVRIALANFVDSLDGPEGTGPLVREISEDINEVGNAFFGGQLMLSLTYSPTLDRMIVTILRAVNINLAENATVLYAKVFLTLTEDVIYSKKTSTVKHSVTPVFNSNILLDQLTDNGTTELSQLGLIVSIRAKTTERKKLVLGQVALGNFKHAKEDGFLHWKEAIESTNVTVAQWHRLVLRR